MELSTEKSVILNSMVHTLHIIIFIRKSKQILVGEKMK